MIKKLISTAIVSSVIGSASANPELGYMTIGTDQYQLFNATIAIDALPSELNNKKLKVKLGSITDFQRHNIEYDKEVSSLRFKVSRGSDGKPQIRVRSVREITASQLQAVIKLTVGSQKIYGIYDFKLTPGRKRQVTLNLLNTDHKPEQPPIAEQPTLTAKRTYSTVYPLPSETSVTALEKEVHATAGHYRVRKGQTISGIAMELLPRYPEVASWKVLMTKLAFLNPEAFINGDINKLRAEAKLKLPGIAQAVSENLSERSKFAYSNSPSDTPPGHGISSTIIIKDLPEELAGKDNLKVQLGSITDYYRQGIDYDSQVSDLEFEIAANSRQETVIKANLTGEISATQLTAVVKISAGRNKVYGLYELRGQQITFNLLDTKTGKKPQIVKNSPSAKTPVEVANKQALEELRNKLKSYEQAKIPENKDIRSSQANGDAARATALEALRKKFAEYKQAHKTATKSRYYNAANQEKAQKAGYQPFSMTGQKTYQVVKGDTLSTIAVKLSKSAPGGWRGVMKRLASNNPGAFIGGDINKIRAGTVLNLPASGHYNARTGDNLMAGEKTYRVARGDTLSTIAVKLSKTNPGGWKGVMKLLVRNNLGVFISGDINKIRAGTLLKLPEASEYNHLYKVAAGDNASTIAWRMRYQYPQPDGWRGVMQQIVHMNPEAFTGGNPDKLLANEILVMPYSGGVKIKAEYQELPGKQLARKKSGVDHSSKRQKTRQKLAKIVRKRSTLSQQPAKARTPNTNNGQWVKSYQTPAKQDKKRFSLTQEPEAQASNADIHRKPQKTHERLVKLTNPSTPEEQLVQHTSETTYKVTESESLAAIANKLIPEYPQFGSWYELLRKLAKLNPSLFVNNNIGAIKKGTVLQLPEKKSGKKMDGISTQSKPEERNKDQSTGERKLRKTTGNVTVPAYNKISNSLLSRVDKLQVYEVPEGYTISMVAIRLLPLYPDYDNWTSLMKAIYELNPDAFINSDINKLRNNSRLKLPEKISS